MDVREALVAPLEDLPPVEFAFAYGSGVFQQPGNSHVARNEAPMVDYILGVKGPVLWHSENLERNPHHYNSWLACLGGKGVSLIADNVGAGVHFNAFVPWKGKVHMLLSFVASCSHDHNPLLQHPLETVDALFEACNLPIFLTDCCVRVSLGRVWWANLCMCLQMIKYGVISMECLTQDILSWKSLYISGRLQKPVKILVDDWDMAKVNQVNLQAAVAVALLLLPTEFSEEELYAKICGLSYMGDVRMLFAEDKNKVCRIVQGSAEHFHSLYRTPLCHMAALGLLELPRSYGSLRSILRRDCSPHAVESLVSSLPTTVLHKVVPQARLERSSGKGILVGDPVNPVQRAIRSIVRTSSMKQVLSGLLAAGGVNSMRYVWKKASKAWWLRC